MSIPAIRSRPTWGRLRCARGAITAITRMHALLTASTVQTGSRTDSLLVSGHGAVAGVTVGAVTTEATAGAMVTVAITEAGAMADAATTGAGKVFRDAEDSTVGTAAVIPAEVVTPGADAALAADIAMEAETHIAAEDAALAEVGAPLTEVDTASVAAVDMASVAVAPMEADTAVAMVVDTGNLHSSIETLAADGTRCRPLCFRAPRAVVMEKRCLLPCHQETDFGGRFPTQSSYFCSVTLK